MALVSWIGNAQNSSQIVSCRVTAVAIAGTIVATINTKVLSYTVVTGDTVDDATAALTALLNASDVPPEFNLATYTVTTDTILATASTPGTPYSGMTGGLAFSSTGGCTIVQSTVQANISQSDVGNLNNWLRSGVKALPQNGDSVSLANSSVPLLWNLDALAAVQFAAYTRDQSFTGSVGLPENNPDGFYEFRPTYFQFISSVGQLPVILGSGQGQGPTRERYNVGSARTNLTVIASGSPQDAYAIRFLGTHPNNRLTVLGTSVGVAMLPTEFAAGTAVIDTATVDGGGTLDLGPGVTFSGTGGGGTLTITGGNSTMYCTPAAVVSNNNATVILSAQGGVYASVSAIDGVQMTLVCAMTITSLTVQKSSNVDNSGNLGAVTITTSVIDGDTCQVLDPNNGIAWSNPTQVAGQVTGGPITFTGPRTLRIV